MSEAITSIDRGVLAPRGFSANGVYCDIKQLGTGKGSNKGKKPDLGLIVSETPAAVAGMFTTNQIRAAPVKVCIPRVRTGVAQAVVVNSGNANACTGERGMRDALAMTSRTAKRNGLQKELVLVASTGRIGVHLPMSRVRAGIESAHAGLGFTKTHADRVAEAILTSDTKAKQVALEFSLGGKTVRLGGICKGAGMIQPGMSRDGQRPAAGPGALHATMLAFLTCDAAVAPRLLQDLLEKAVAQSFNRITVDGDMSTNDTVLLLANGLADNPLLQREGLRGRRKADCALLQSALNEACLNLAKMIVLDGEGVHRVVKIFVSGARNDREADWAARSVGNSALVKTSWHGGDPNWGRIIDALGYSEAVVVEDKVDIGYVSEAARRPVFSLRGGRSTRTSFATLCAAVEPKEFELRINLNLGEGEAVLYASDLTEAYVDFNKGDVTDPASLGG